MGLPVRRSLLAASPFLLLLVFASAAGATSSTRKAWSSDSFRDILSRHLEDFRAKAEVREKLAALSEVILAEIEERAERKRHDDDGHHRRIRFFWKKRNHDGRAGGWREYDEDGRGHFDDEGWSVRWHEHDGSCFHDRDRHPDDSEDPSTLVPEPGTAGLLGLGVALLATARRRAR